MNSVNGSSPAPAPKSDLKVGESYWLACGRATGPLKELVSDLPDVPQRFYVDCQNPVASIDESENVQPIVWDLDGDVVDYPRWLRDYDLTIVEGPADVASGIRDGYWYYPEYAGPVCIYLEGDVAKSNSFLVDGAALCWDAKNGKFTYDSKLEFLGALKRPVLITDRFLGVAEITAEWASVFDPKEIDEVENRDRHALARVFLPDGKYVARLVKGVQSAHESYLSFHENHSIHKFYCNGVNVEVVRRYMPPDVARITELARDADGKIIWKTEDEWNARFLESFDKPAAGSEEFVCDYNEFDDWDAEDRIELTPEAEQFVQGFTNNVSGLIASGLALIESAVESVVERAVAAAMLKGEVELAADPIPDPEPKVGTLGEIEKRHDVVALYNDKIILKTRESVLMLRTVNVYVEYFGQDTIRIRTGSEETIDFPAELLGEVCRAVAAMSDILRMRKEVANNE